MSGTPLNDAANFEALMRAVTYLQAQAESECYVMCSCQDRAQETLADIVRILDISGAELTLWVKENA